MLLIITVTIILFAVVLLFGAPYLPTRRHQIETTLDMLKIDEQSTIVDLGSGDGKMLAAAARRGATAYGFELNPLLVTISWLRCLRFKKAHVELANFWKTPLPDDTTAVFTFLLARFMKRFDKKMQAEATRLGQPIIVASYSFPIPHKKANDVKQGIFLYTYIPEKPNR